MESHAALETEDIVANAMTKLSALALIALGACAGNTDPIVGGNAGTGATGGSGASGGSSAGVSGGGGSSTSGTGGQSTTTGGGTTGTAGSIGTGAGGTTGVAGRGGTTGAAGSAAGRGGSGGSAAGTTGRGGSAAGTTGRGGTGGTAGTTGTGGASSGDDFVSGVTITVHPQTTTILNVTWTQAKVSDQVSLEFTFAGGTVMTSRQVAGTTGAHKDVVLGVPASTAITVRIVNKLGGVDYKTKDYMGMTGAIPSGMPKPTVSMYDATLASPDRWMFGAVEASPGGCNNSSCYYTATFWLYIMDRQGRIVWYYADAANGNPTSSFQRIAKDGEYIWIEKRPFGGSGTHGVLKMTLDRQFSQMVSVANLSDCIDVTPDGSLLYDTEPQWELRELTKAGTTRAIFNCPQKMGSGFDCYSNTVNYDAASDSIIMSYPYENTVAQIDRTTGNLIATYGARTGSYTFDQANWKFEFQHFANISSRGTLMVSSHLPGYGDGEAGTMMPVANKHSFQEWTIDRTNKKLLQKWIYSDGAEWAMYKGMVILLPNGNYLANYGTGGVIREITPDKKTVFYVKWDVTTGDDFFNRMVGNNVLINDLYALNGGGPK